MSLSRSDGGRARWWGLCVDSRNHTWRDDPRDSLLDAHACSTRALPGRPHQDQGSPFCTMNMCGSFNTPPWRRSQPRFDARKRRTKRCNPCRFWTYRRPGSPSRGRSGRTWKEFRQSRSLDPWGTSQGCFVVLCSSTIVPSTGRFSTLLATPVKRGSNLPDDPPRPNWRNQVPGSLICRISASASEPDPGRQPRIFPGFGHGDQRGTIDDKPARDARR
jgi:hypothetical protein